jgi:hypothetical protein
VAVRKRKAIPLKEKLAAALACLLSQEERDRLRHGKAEAGEVLKLFHYDHIVLHAHDGSDRWHNLDPKLVATHREKSARDTAIVAKVKRLIEKPVRRQRKRKWSRRLRSRPFPKSRRM